MPSLCLMRLLTRPCAAANQAARHILQPAASFMASGSPAAPALNRSRAPKHPTTAAQSTRHRSLQPTPRAISGNLQAAAAMHILNRGKWYCHRASLCTFGASRLRVRLLSLQRPVQRHVVSVAVGRVMVIASARPRAARAAASPFPSCGKQPCLPEMPRRAGKWRGWNG